MNTQLPPVPDEILAEVLKHVDGNTVFQSVPLVCKRWNKVGEQHQEFIWKHIFERESRHNQPVEEGDDLERGKTRISQSLKLRIEDSRSVYLDNDIPMTSISGDWKNLWIYFFVATRQRKKKVRPIHYLPAKKIGKRISLMMLPVIILGGSLGYHFYILNLVATAYYAMMRAHSKEEREDASGGMSLGGLLACTIIIAMSIFVQLALVGVLMVYAYFQFLVPRYVDRRVTGGI